MASEVGSPWINIPIFVTADKPLFISRFFAITFDQREMAQKRSTDETDCVVPVDDPKCDEKRVRTETPPATDEGGTPTIDRAEGGTPTQPPPATDGDCADDRTRSPAPPATDVEVELPPPLGAFTVKVGERIDRPVDPEKEEGYHTEVAEAAVELLTSLVREILARFESEEERLKVANEILAVLETSLRLMAKAVSTEPNYCPETWMFDEVIMLYNGMVKGVAGGDDHPVMLLFPMLNDFMSDKIPTSMGKVLMEMLGEDGREQLYSKLYEGRKSRLSEEDADAILFSDDPLTVQTLRAVHDRVPLERKEREEE